MFAMFFIVGNNAGLDLVNTRGVQDGKPFDLLNSFKDLVSWSSAAGVIDEARARKIIGKWSGTAEADRVFKRALQLRDSLSSIGDELVQGGRPSAERLKDLNDLLRRKSGWFEVRVEENGYAKAFHADLDDIDGILVPIGESVADLLCFGDLSQVKRCESDECVLVFHDTSKNHRRRWCSMATCGNRAKANAFYKRKTHGS